MQQIWIYFDMTDGARRIINFQPDSGSNSCKFKSASVKNIFMKVNDFFVCVICSKKFTQKSDYQNHKRTHEKHESATYSCNICNKSFAVPARLTRHYRTHTGEKPYQCEYCTKSFSVKENLSVHRRIHTKERPYRCDVCQSGFEHSGKLHRHMRIHTGERPHKCSICDKTFIQSGQLVIHMRTHTGEKPYICKLCGKGFTCSKQLKVHTRTHTGEKPYRCDICGKSFGYNHVLKLHQVAHYGEKFYKCILCQTSFNSKKLMEIHMKSPSNCKVYDAAKLNSTTSQTVDFINEILPCHVTHPKCMIESIANRKHNESKQIEEKPVSYEICDMNKKKNPVLHYESYPNNSKNPIKISQQKLASDIVIPYRIEDPQSFSLFCQHSAIDEKKFDSDPHELKEYTFITPVTPSKVPSFYSNLEESTVSWPIKKENLSAHKKLTMCYENISQVYTMNSLLHKSSLNIIIPNSRDDSSLTPHKRSKVVSESLLQENFGYETSMRCNSVIKFAKTDRII